MCVCVCVCVWVCVCLQVKHMLGSSREAESTIEENTHIAYLCDLLERIWGHGLKKREVHCVQSQAVPYPT